MKNISVLICISLDAGDELFCIFSGFLEFIFWKLLFMSFALGWSSSIDVTFFYFSFLFLYIWDTAFCSHMLQIFFVHFFL